MVGIRMPVRPAEDFFDNVRSAHPLSSTLRIPELRGQTPTSSDASALPADCDFVASLSGHRKAFERMNLFIKSETMNSRNSVKILKILAASGRLVIQMDRQVCGDDFVITTGGSTLYKDRFKEGPAVFGEESPISSSSGRDIPEPRMVAARIALVRYGQEQRYFSTVADRDRSLSQVQQSGSTEMRTVA